MHSIRREDGRKETSQKKKPMKTEDIAKHVAIYLIAIGPNGMPSSYVWMAVDPQMADVNLHQRTISVLQDAGIVKMSNHFITLTEKGLAMHEKFVEVLAS